MISRRAREPSSDSNSWPRFRGGTDYLVHFGAAATIKWEVEDIECGGKLGEERSLSFWCVKLYFHAFDCWLRSFVVGLCWVGSVPVQLWILVEHCGSYVLCLRFFFFCF